LAAAPQTVPARGAAANLQAAMGMQSTEVSDVENFLTSSGLDRYVSVFVDNGFDCMEVVLEMQESHMKEMGMAPGHVIKLKKRIGEINPQPVVSVAPASASHGVTATRRVSFGGSESAGCGGGSLLDGTFDEEANAASFADAVAAWRGDTSPPSPTAITAPCGQSEGTTATSLSGAPGSFWTAVGGVEVDLVRASTPLHHAPPAEAEAGAQVGPDAPLAPSEDKLCCYLCYKQFFAQFVVERLSPLPGGGMKRLCSDACADRWEASATSRANELRKRAEKLENLQRALASNSPEASVTAASVDTAGDHCTYDADGLAQLPPAVAA